MNPTGPTFKAKTAKKPRKVQKQPAPASYKEDPLYTELIGIGSKARTMRADTLEKYDNLLNCPEVLRRAGPGASVATRAARAHEALMDAIASIPAEETQQIAEAALCADKQYEGLYISQRVLDMPGIEPSKFDYQRGLAFREIIAFLRRQSPDPVDRPSSYADDTPTAQHPTYPASLPDAHNTLAHAHEMLRRAQDQEDQPVMLLYLDKLRAVARTQDVLRPEIARIIASLLASHQERTGTNTTLQQQCMSVLAACFSDGTPFSLTHDQQLRYPTSISSWRNHDPLPTVLDLSGLSFSDVDFSGLRLSVIDFSATTFRRCSFVGSYFECCNFSEAELVECRLTDITGIFSVLASQGDYATDQTPAETSVMQCLYKGDPVPTRPWHKLAVIFKFCVFQQARLVDVLGSGACFWACDLSRMNAGSGKIPMRHVDFCVCDLSQASFQGMDLAESLFVGCDLRYADFRQTSLRMATIDSPLFLHAFFQGANLQRVLCLEKRKDEILRTTVWDKDTLFPWPPETPH